MRSFLADDHGQSEGLQQLFRGEDWKASFYPKVTPAVRSLVHQMWHAPYRGVVKRLYLQAAILNSERVCVVSDDEVSSIELDLNEKSMASDVCKLEFRIADLQAKVFELLALHLDLISDSASQPQSGSGLKPDTVARLHYAKEILANQLENPPLLSELAQMVGVSDRTLQRGFKSLFHTTVVGYLKQQRLYQAERLLRQGHCTVADVATRVGYGHLGRFAAEFKQQFGITPKACLVGKRGDG